MSEIPSDLLYRESHEWVRYDEDGTATVGISDHAQAQLGDMVFVELPEPGMSYEQGDACAVVESVKAAYGDGWLFRMQLSNPSELDGLLNPEAYAEQAES